MGTHRFEHGKLSCSHVRILQNLETDDSLSRWAVKNPSRVERLILLCPAFDMASGWNSIFQEHGIKEWKDTGSKVSII